VIMMVSRNGHAFIPTGRSTLHAHDKLLVFADRERLAATMKIMEAYDPQQIPGPRGDVV
jgi:Trk K+ transport system NAD-binding subunit